MTPPTMTPERPPTRPRRPQAIDPRIRQRRAAVLRSQARRRLRIVITVAVAAVVIGGGWGILHTKLFSARVITVLGAVHTPAASVVAAAGLSGHPPLIDVSGSAAAGIERLPWVTTATVSRQWPDGVRITVTERVPVAAVALVSPAGATAGSTPSAGSATTTSTTSTGATTTTTAAGAKTTTTTTTPTTTTTTAAGSPTAGAPATGGFALIDRTGRVLADVGSVPAGVVQVSMPTAPGRPGSTIPGAGPALKVAASLPAAFIAQVTAVVETSPEKLTLQLTSPVTVDLGSTVQLGQKFEDVAAILAGATLHTGDVIDVTAPRAPVVSGP